MRFFHCFILLFNSGKDGTRDEDYHKNRKLRSALRQFILFVSRKTLTPFLASLPAKSVSKWPVRLESCWQVREFRSGKKIVVLLQWEWNPFYYISLYKMEWKWECRLGKVHFHPRTPRVVHQYLWNPRWLRDSVGSVTNAWVSLSWSVIILNSGELPDAQRVSLKPGCGG